MSETPHAMLLMLPFAGYDRGLLHGIAYSDMASTMQRKTFASDNSSLI
jgi:hypothetical protein